MTFYTEVNKSHLLKTSLRHYEHSLKCLLVSHKSLMLQILLKMSNKTLHMLQINLRLTQICTTVSKIGLNFPE